MLVLAPSAATYLALFLRICNLNHSSKLRWIFFRASAEPSGFDNVQPSGFDNVQPSGFDNVQSSGFDNVQSSGFDNVEGAGDGAGEK